jgi:hypothetical protein
MIDATELADAIAGAMARVLEQQNDFWRSTATFERTESPAASARPRTAARHAMHIDVVLSGLAALFVLVILLAWLG